METVYKRSTRTIKEPLTFDEVKLLVKDLTHDKKEAYRQGYDEYYTPKYSRRYKYPIGIRGSYEKGHIVEICFAMCLGIFKRYLKQNDYNTFYTSIDYSEDLYHSNDLSLYFYNIYTKSMMERKIQLKLRISDIYVADSRDFVIVSTMSGSDNIKRFLQFYDIVLPDIDAFDYECMMEDINDIFYEFHINA